MKGIVKRSRFSGYKGFDRIGRESSRALETFEENLKHSDMGNPFIGDAYFKDNPTKVLGEQYEDHGQYGNVIIKVRGGVDELQKIDAQPVKTVDLYPTENLSVETKQEIINTVFDKETEKIKKERKTELRTGRKQAEIITPGHLNQEVYSYKEISAMYNKEISRDEMEAYYLTHPELNYKLLIDDFTNTIEELMDKGLICIENDRPVYLYTYQSGNISRKISYLKRDREKIIAKYSEKQWDRQMKFLTDVMPKSKSFIGDDKITLLPHSNFAREHKITELKFGKPELWGETSLFDAFKRWLYSLPSDEFKKSNSREVIDYYLDNKSIPIDSNHGKEQQVRDEKNAINIKQRTKEDGDLLFARFLADELKPEDQSRISYLWNEKFNSISEPNLSKIPVCFQISKTFKAGVPFSLNPTQRQAAAFGMEKFSDLLAYGVGVGKTASAIVCCSQAFSNNLAKKFLFAVPTNTYDKWIGEIQGYTDKESGQFMQGLLPHMPPVIGIYNLNPGIVREKLKDYSKDDEAKFASIEDAIEALRKVETDSPKSATRDAISKLYPINWLGLEAQHRVYLENSKAKKSKSLTEFAIDYLKEEYNYHIYSLGSIKNFPDGTIFVTTEVGIQRLGVSDANRDELTARMFKILSQGETTDPKNRAKEIAGLQMRIEQTISSGLKNAKLFLEDMGIDWVCFDEAHLYKKLFTFVKGSITQTYEGREGETVNKRDKSKYELKSGAYPSARALSAFVISHYVQSKNQNRNVIQLTATPFTNSPLEVYSMLTLTNYKTLEDMGMDNMVDFFDTFMKINYDIKYTPQKTVVKDVVLTGYNNLPQLRQIIYSLMDKKDAGAGLKRPTKIVFPSIQNGIETTLPMTVEQNDLVRNVKAYIMGDESYEAICAAAQQDEIEAIDFDGLDDESLILEWERITGKEYEGERESIPEARRETLIKGIKGAKQDGIELGVDDLTEDESLGVKILKGLSMLRQITLSPFLYYKACRKAAKQELVLPDYQEYIETSPKLKYVMGCIKSVIDFHVARNEKISGQVIYMNAGVEYFPLIKEYCVKKLHLKESQVGIVSGGMSKNAKENVKQGFLRGDILVLIGSSTISVGVDLQNNATCLYNCYYDWNPTDAAQIEGRIWRQGNRFAFVRINYPQCFNSADPVIFEYLNSKTLRINEIWNRSSEVNELDLRDFDPKALQKKLITDPEEKADWEILEETDALEGNILFYENRKQQLQDSIQSFQNYKKLRPQAIQWLHELSDKKLENTRKTAIANQKEKISELVDKYMSDPAKMATEIENYKKSRYDYENDPEGKFVSFNYNQADDSVLINDAKKWEQIVDDWGWKDQEVYPEFYSKGYEIKRILREFRINTSDMMKAQERILKPMGLNFENLDNPLESFNEKLDKLREEREAIEASKPQRIERIIKEFAAMGGFSKTVEDRIAEFASYNEQYLTQFLSTEKEPVEIPAGNNEVTPAAPPVEQTPEHESTEVPVYVTPEVEVPAVAETIEVVKPAKKGEPKEKNLITVDQITEAISKYGWHAEPDGENIAAFNRKGKKVVVIEQKGNKYKFLDTLGNKLMDGRGQLIIGLEKLLKELYFVELIDKKAAYDETEPVVGKVIGKTKSGKYVYEKYDSIPQDYTRQDLLDASEIHSKRANGWPSGKIKDNYQDYASAFSSMALMKQMNDVFIKPETVEAPAPSVPLDLKGNPKPERLMTFEEFFEGLKPNLPENGKYAEDAMREHYKKLIADSLESKFTLGKKTNKTLFDDINEGRITLEGAIELIKNAGVEVPKGMETYGAEPKPVVSETIEVVPEPVPAKPEPKPGLSQEAILKLIKGLETAEKYASGKEKTKIKKQIADLRSQLLKQAA